MDFLLRSEIEMDFLGSSLCRLQKYVPSAALWDVPSLKAQIELRQRALTDIEIIRRQLRPSCGASRPRGAIAPEFGELASDSSLKLRLGSPT
jgi:hypothetical protein